MNTEIEPYLLHLYFSEEDGKYHNFVNAQHYEATVSSGKWLIKSLSVTTKNQTSQHYGGQECLNVRQEDGSTIPSEPVVETWSNRSSEVQEACEKIEARGLYLMTGEDVGPYIVWLLRSLNDIADGKHVGG